MHGDLLGLIENPGRGRGGYSIYPWVGRCSPVPQTLNLFKVLLKRNFRIWDVCIIIKFQPCLQALSAFLSPTVCKTRFCSHSKLAGLAENWRPFWRGQNYLVTSLVVLVSRGAKNLRLKVRDVAGGLSPRILRLRNLRAARMSRSVSLTHNLRHGSILRPFLFGLDIFSRYSVLCKRSSVLDLLDPSCSSTRTGMASTATSQVVENLEKWL